MRAIVWVLIMGIWTICGYSQDVKHQFVGAATCKVCHKGEKKGSQFEIWEASKHAMAFKTLASDEAMKVAKEKGIENPQTDGKCLKCHTAGYGASDDLFTDKFNKEDGVQCENCHGAGSDYKKNAIMKSREESIANGMMIALVSDGSAEKLCKTCHNEESPSFKGFDFNEYWKKIAHPVVK